MTATDRATPPSADELRAALTRLRPVSPAAAALHLALPVTEVGGIGAVSDGGALHYRGVVVAQTGDPVHDAAALAAAGHRDGDAYLDLTADAAALCKPLRTGFRGVAFGSDILLGLPLVAYELGLPVAAVTEVLAAAAGDRVPLTPPVVVATGAGPVLVDGTGSSWVLRDPAGAAGPGGDPPATVAARASARAVAADLLATAVEVVELGSRFPGSRDLEYVCTLPDGWEAIVPATLGPGCEQLGVPREQVAAAAEGALPAGFRWRGRALWEDAMVAEHAASGLVVLLRPAGPRG